MDKITPTNDTTTSPWSQPPPLVLKHAPLLKLNTATSIGPSGFLKSCLRRDGGSEKNSAFAPEAIGVARDHQS